MRKTIMIPLNRSGAIRQYYNSTWRIGGGGGGGTATATVTTIGAGGGGGGGTNAGAWSARSGRGVTLGPLLGQRIQAQRTISSCAVLRNHHKDGPKHASTLTSSAGGRGSSAQSQSQSQSQSPLGQHVGVAAALAAGRTGPAKPTLWDEFALRDRVALVSGANRGLGLEMALVLVEAGARAVYCVDLPAQPGDEWAAVAEYVKRMGTSADAEGGNSVGGRLEYVSGDVRDQKAMWKIGEEIGDREGRMDVCVAAAGILRSHMDCLEYPAEEFEEVRPIFFGSHVTRILVLFH